MGLAHTRNVDYGKIEATATASLREFMLQPNMPRFVRVGDKAENIAASLMNLSDKGVKGTVCKFIQSEARYSITTEV